MLDGAPSAAKQSPRRSPKEAGLKVAGLFAGIGGIELGLQQAGHESLLLCEVMEGARTVLKDRFPSAHLVGDVRELRPEDLEGAEVVTAGFPCQDLSQAGRTEGIRGQQSGLIQQVFALLEKLHEPPKWLVLENVTFMLHLDRGEGMRFLASELRRLGYRWAYRVVDTRAFGLPQRRLRVILVASKHDELDPRRVLFADDQEPRAEGDYRKYPCGFYWTEGLRGLGWAVDAVPPLKGGSTIGIASPPAIWLPSNDYKIVTPGLADAEKLQGFTPGWTKAADSLQGPGTRNIRWKLVGNAVSVPIAKWLGTRLFEPGDYDVERPDAPLTGKHKWPTAAWGDRTGTYAVSVSTWPVREPYKHLERFLRRSELVPLSLRATAGFYERAQRSTLNFDKIPEFLPAVGEHLARMKQAK